MITFKNGIKLDTCSINGGTMHFQNANRATLEIKCSTKTITFDELRNLYKDADSLSELIISEIQSYQKGDANSNPVYIDTITGEETLVAEGNNPAMVDVEVVLSTHLNYSIPVELRLTTLNGQEVYCMKIAQMSMIELEQKRQAEELAITQIALMELASMAGGE